MSLNRIIPDRKMSQGGPELTCSQSLPGSCVALWLLPTGGSPGPRLLNTLPVLHPPTFVKIHPGGGAESRLCKHSV